MTPGLKWLLIAWGIVTGILLILLFYRSTLTRQEDDQLFIDESSASKATEQQQLIAKVNKINPLVKIVGATSGVMILIIAGWAVYLGLNSVQP
jgi:hypothetical protein